MKRFGELGITAPKKGFVGNKIKMGKILNKEVKILSYAIEPSNFKDKAEGERLALQLEVDGEKRIAWSGSSYLKEMIQKVPESNFPFLTTIKEVDEHHEFT